MKKQILCFLMSIIFSPLFVKAQTAFPIHPIEASEAYAGVKGRGTLEIRTIHTGAQHRPLLIIEGFDPGHILKPEDRYGETDLSTFLKEVNKLIGGSADLRDFVNNQYDIYYLNWTNGTDYLQRNALVAEEAIKWINAQKAALGSVEPLVVLGQSMGGVIGRYALRDMENNGQNHETKLFISHDAPQLGANVPQGYQHLARHARDLYIQSGATASTLETIMLAAGQFSPYYALNLVNEHATRQMLVNRVNDFNTIDNSEHDQWQAELLAMDYPQGIAGIPFERVSISNGSECATTQPYTAGANLFSYQGKGSSAFLSTLGLSGIVLSTSAGLFNQPAFVLGTLPGKDILDFDFAINAKAYNTGNQVYKGKITYTKKLFGLINITSVLTNRSFNAAASTLPYDYYPGGQYDLREQNFDLQSVSSSNYWTKYNINVNYQPTFCFVPVPSALDIGGGTVSLAHSNYLTPYSGGHPPAPPYNSPFQNFITEFNAGNSSNQSHISFSRRDGDWLAEELNNHNPVADCALFCNSATLGGNEVLCTASNYTLTGVPAGTSINWSASPAGIVAITPQGPGNTTATLTPVGNGNVTLSASITSTICGTTTLASKSISVGITPPGPISFPLIDAGSGKVFAEVPPDLAAISYNWYLNGTLNTLFHNSNARFNVPKNPCDVEYEITVEVITSCGTSSLTGGILFFPCDSYFRISPNPAKGSINVVVDEQKISDSKSAQINTGSTQTNKPAVQPKLIYSVRITDQTGNVKKTVNYKSGVKSLSVSLAGIPAGLYIVSVFDNVSWKSQSVIIE